MCEKPPSYGSGTCHTTGASLLTCPRGSPMHLINELVKLAMAAGDDVSEAAAYAPGNNGGVDLGSGSFAMTDPPSERAHSA